MVGLFGLASARDWCVDVCLSPKLHLPSCCLILLGLTEGCHPGDIVTPSVITPGQPDDQLHVTAAKPGEWLHSFCSEMWGQLHYPGGAWLTKGKWPVTERIASLLMMNFWLTWKEKELFTQVLLLLDVYLWSVGCRNLGQPMADTQWHLSADASPVLSLPESDPWLDP